MTITNTIYYRDLDFADYLQMPGTSFSSLKGEIPTSAGMQLGTRVHNYLFTPLAYDWQQAEIVRPIAAAIRNHPLLKDSFIHLEKEIAFTCELHHNGMKLLYKGRADMLRIGRIVIDLKILAGSLESACERFGYPDQLSGYCLPTLCPLALIIAYNKSRKQVETKIIIPGVAFWQYQVVSRGVPA